MLKEMYHTSLNPIIREIDMWYPTYIRACVVFLCTNSRDRDDYGRTMIPKPRATGFFVCVPLDDNRHGGYMIYLVTARHNVDESREYGDLFVRLDKRGGGFRYERIVQDDFVPHPKTDVAILHFYTPDAVEINCLPYAKIIEPRESPIQEGEDVFIAGLFSPYSGEERNQPIFRFGKISLAQPDKIPLRLSPETEPVPVDAYLIESLSWGGESGSPVFVVVDQKRMPKSDTLLPPYQLLGLVHGHFEIPKQVTHQMQKIGETDLNAGIMAVIPVQAIIETLNLEEVVNKRKKALLDFKRKHTVTPVPDFRKDDKPFTRDDYLRDLGKVFGRKADKDKPKSDEGNSQT